jgi:tripartite-type tricarboxylate transporter receptor subunit TctC
VLSGEADAMVAPLTGALNLVKARRFRLLATLGDERNAVIPDVPTASELGYDTVFDLFRGLSVPSGTPEPVKAALADAMTRASRSDAFMKLAQEVGFTVDPMPAAAFEALIRAEDARVRAIIESADLLSDEGSR